MRTLGFNDKLFERQTKTKKSKPNLSTKSTHNFLGGKVSVPVNQFFGLVHTHMDVVDKVQSTPFLKGQNQKKGMHM